MSIDAASTTHGATKLQQRFAACYEHGMQLMKRDKNYDYAHAMFAECVTHEPSNLKYVEALLENLRSQTPQAKKKSLLGMRNESKAVNQSIAAKKWPEAIRLGIEQLKNDPWEVGTLRALAEVSRNLHCNEVELVYLKQALDANPKDIEVNRHCALSLARMGQFDQAIACWHRVEKLRPGNKEAAIMIAQLSEEKLKYPGGRPVATAQTPKVQNDIVSVAEETVAEVQALELSPRQKLEKAISHDPHDISNYLGLADLLAESERFQEAEAVLLRGIAVCGEHGALKDRLRDVQLLRSKVESEAAEARRREIERRNRPFKIPWLEGVLALAGCALLLQLFPPVAAATWSALDFRHWSHAGWIVVNFVALVVLFGIHLRPKFSAKRKQHRRSRLA